MKLLMVLLALLNGMSIKGRIVSQVYEGYEKHNDIYIAEVQGMRLFIVSDDFCDGDEFVISIDSEGYHCRYAR